MLSLTTDLEGLLGSRRPVPPPRSAVRRAGACCSRAAAICSSSATGARFGEQVLAELRGVIDDDGNSPFWDAIAGRFFDMSFPEADDFNAIHGTRFIADLMPRTPIYVALLTEARGR